MPGSSPATQREERRASLSPPTSRVETTREMTDDITCSNKSPSLENPTWEYLFNNFNKLELQKLCRSQGLKKVWTTKDKLVDMIMAAHRPTTSQPEEEESDVLRRIEKDINGLRDLIKKKDLEIENLNQMVQGAYVTINRLNDRVSTLEERVNTNGERHHSDDADGELMHPSVPVPEKTLLLGDAMLSGIRKADLGENCSIRTIQGATMDLLRCWVNEKMNWTPARCIIYCGTQELI